MSLVFISKKKNKPTNVYEECFSTLNNTKFTIGEYNLSWIFFNVYFQIQGQANSSYMPLLL